MARPLTRSLVVLFLVVDAVLGVLAWRHVTEGRATAAPTGGSVGGISTETDAPAPGSSGTDEFQPADPATATMIDAYEDNLILATAGICDGTEPTVLVSEDGGRNFAPVKPEVGRVLAVVARSNGSFEIVGTDDDCEPVRVSSTDGGATWNNAPLGSRWYRDPQSLTGVIVGAKPTDAGCEVMALSDASPTVARVSCADGTIRGTEDGGATWTAIGGIKGVRALSFDSPDNGVALVQANDCAAKAYSTTDGGNEWLPRGCIEGQTAQAVFLDGDRLLAAVDTIVSQSSDSGLTWSPAGSEPATNDDEDAEPSADASADANDEPADQDGSPTPETR